MKTKLAVLMIVALVIPVLANEFKPCGEDRGSRGKLLDHAERPARTEWPKEQREERRERRYQLMDKSLTQIGVSEEEKIKIRQLQDSHRDRMKSNGKRSDEAREIFSRLRESGASEADMYDVIDEIAETQAEQLKILVRNQMEMERILGKEKYTELMGSARTQFRSHGRHGGSGLPPRPGFPPAKKGDKKKTALPMNNESFSPARSYLPNLSDFERLPE